MYLRQKISEFLYIGNTVAGAPNIRGVRLLKVIIVELRVFFFFLFCCNIPLLEIVKKSTKGKKKSCGWYGLLSFWSIAICLRSTMVLRAKKTRIQKRDKYDNEDTRIYAPELEWPSRNYSTKRNRVPCIGAVMGRWMEGMVGKTNVLYLIHEWWA